jgi:hypothetical protein
MPAVALLLRAVRPAPEARVEYRVRRAARAYTATRLVQPHPEPALLAEGFVDLELGESIALGVPHANKEAAAPGAGILPVEGHQRGPHEEQEVGLKSAYEEVQKNDVPIETAVHLCTVCSFAVYGNVGSVLQLALLGLNLRITNTDKYNAT